MWFPTCLAGNRHEKLDVGPGGPDGLRLRHGADAVAENRSPGGRRATGGGRFRQRLHHRRAAVAAELTELPGDAYRPAPLFRPPGSAGVYSAPQQPGEPESAGHGADRRHGDAGRRPLQQRPRQPPVGARRRHLAAAAAPTLERAAIAETTADRPGIRGRQTGGGQPMAAAN